MVRKKKTAYSLLTIEELKKTSLDSLTIGDLGSLAQDLKSLGDKLNASLSGLDSIRGLKPTTSSVIDNSSININQSASRDMLFEDDYFVGNQQLVDPSSQGPDTITKMDSVIRDFDPSTTPSYIDQLDIPSSNIDQFIEDSKVDEVELRSQVMDAISKLPEGFSLD